MCVFHVDKVIPHFDSYYQHVTNITSRQVVKLLDVSVHVLLHLLQKHTKTKKMADHITITLAKEYGYVVLAATSSFLVNMWLMHNIGGKRKEYGIDYPQMWSEKFPTFNCYQRAHQNMLEGIPFFLSLLFAGGVRHPCVAAAAGFAYCIGRVIYAKGYYSGHAEKRIPGAALSMLSMMILMGTSVSTAASFLGWF